MYLGKFDCRVTIRCPFCLHVTFKEMDIGVEKDMLGNKVAEILTEFPCNGCARMVFKTQRFEIPSLSAIEKKGLVRA